jgi:hypothetical protein
MRCTIKGVSRVADNERVILVSLSERPTDDELREIHDYLRSMMTEKEKRHATRLTQTRLTQKHIAED